MSQEFDENNWLFILQEQLNSTLAGALFLVISNIFIAPAIWISLYFSEVPSAIVYFNVLVASAMYHSCRAGFVCVVAYFDHRKLDYLFVYFAVLWTLTTGLGKSHAISYQLRLLVFNIFILPVAILIVGNYEGHSVQVVGGLLPALVMIVVANNRGVPLFRRPVWAALALVLGGTSALFMFALPHNTYEWSHSVWHVLSMLALFCLIYSTKRRYDFVNPFDDPERFPRPPPRPLIAARQRSSAA